ncbi:hypothetical protein LSH36_356g00005 [Paralvinella palmiformis]|uniref:Transposable element P transposase-like RNase H domain-containing protein n=1 Tax=Paralvinella palmiformis TaxID=53620 RepID=A0AAD9JEC8_9ANNE|nr:hypothetical protein LSH36_356g00005 [Paralvinella palmiformis]
MCSLMLDKMDIRRHVDWDGEKFRGYVDFGTGCYCSCVVLTILTLWNARRSEEVSRLLITEWEDAKRAVDSIRDDLVCFRETSLVADDNSDGEDWTSHEGGHYVSASSDGSEVFEVKPKLTKLYGKQFF